MDTPGAEIYHIQVQNGRSIVDRVSSNNQRSAVCEDLGYHPSDLLQANCVIWVEGPSDRIYINYWLGEVRPDFVEGIHYSIMFYGGRLAAHLSNEDLNESIKEFISLRRLNRRGVMLLDSDRPKKHARINETKRRLEQEFDKGPGHAWITDGREIENYLPAAHLMAAMDAVAPSCTPLSAFGKFDRTLEVKSKGGKLTQAPKVDVARFVAAQFKPDFSVLDLRQRMTKLVAFIAESNPNSSK